MLDDLLFPVVGAVVVDGVVFVGVARVHADLLIGGRGPSAAAGGIEHIDIGIPRAVLIRVPAGIGQQVVQTIAVYVAGFQLKDGVQLLCIPAGEIKQGIVVILAAVNGGRQRCNRSAGAVIADLEQDDFHLALVRTIAFAVGAQRVAVGRFRVHGQVDLARGHAGERVLRVRRMQIVLAAVRLKRQAQRVKGALCRGARPQPAAACGGANAHAAHDDGGNEVDFAVGRPVL